jgi:hypothetical protein
MTEGRCRRTWHGLLWRIVPHNRFVRHWPFHPSRYEFWYCTWCRRALCCQGWLGRDHPDYWVPYKPGLLWNGSLDHWQPDILYSHDRDGGVRAYAVRRPEVGRARQDSLRLADVSTRGRHVTGAGT